MKSSRFYTLAASALFTLAILAVLATVWLIPRSPEQADASTNYASGAQGSKQATDNQQPQATPTQAAKTTITVRGSVSVSAQPDTLNMSIGVTIFDKTVKAAQDQASTVLNSMIDKLKTANISASDYNTSQYTVEPVMDYSGQKGGAPDQAPTLIGFRVSNILQITLHDPSKAPGLIDSLVSAGANTVYSVNYTFNNGDELSKQAYDAAMKDAQARATRLAALSNLTLGRILSVTDAAANVPGPVFDGSGGKGGAGTGPILPGSQSVQSDLIVTFEAIAK